MASDTGKGRSQRTEETIAIEDEYLSTHSWQNSKSYILLQARIADGTLPPEHANIEPVIDMEGVVGAPTSHIPTDIQVGMKKESLFL